MIVLFLYPSPGVMLRLLLLPCKVATPLFLHRYTMLIYDLGLVTKKASATMGKMLSASSEVWALMKW